MAEKKKATRRRKTEAKSVGLTTAEVRATSDPCVRELTAHVEVTNALNRENPCCVDYSVVQRDSVYVLERDTEHWLPLIPSIGVLWTF